MVGKRILTLVKWHTIEQKVKLSEIEIWLYVLYNVYPGPEVKLNLFLLSSQMIYNSSWSLYGLITVKEREQKKTSQARV